MKQKVFYKNLHIYIKWVSLLFSPYYYITEESIRRCFEKYGA